MKHLATRFAEDLPHTIAPYNSRAWGHKFHSLCSYQGKLKPAIAHFLVTNFSKPGDLVLDPLGGVGTVAFEAALQGRRAITNDISPLAHAVAAAKISAFNADEILVRLNELETQFDKFAPSEASSLSVLFGLNGTVADYYHKQTLREILYFRETFAKQCVSSADIWIRANLLHLLHGNRPYALSRISHPVTPMNPRGPFIYKNVFQHIRNRIKALQKQQIPESFLPGLAIQGGFEMLSAKVLEEVDLIITSPPFLGMRFDRPNWLRLWFLGWGAQDFHTQSLEFLDRRQTKGFECYSVFFETLLKLLKPGGLLIMHLGGSAEASMGKRIIEVAPPALELMYDFEESVEGRESFGISDRGKTKTHEYLFFAKPQSVSKASSSSSAGRLARLDSSAA